MRVACLGRCVLRGWNASSSAAASALALFGALNVLVGLLGGADRNHLWVHGGNGAGTLVTLGVLAFALGRFGGRHLASAAPPLHRLGAWLLGTLCTLDALGYADLRAGGSLASPLWCSTRREPPPRPPWRRSPA